MRMLLISARILSILCVIYTSVAVLLISALSRSGSPLARFSPFVCIAVVICLYKFRKSTYNLLYTVLGFIIFIVATLLHQSSINASTKRYLSYQPTTLTELFSFSGLTGRMYTDLIVAICIFACLIYLTQLVLKDNYN